jgi:YD repeat-containing protein
MIKRNKRCQHINTVFLWGYDSSYPIAEIKNASLTQVLAALGYTQTTYETEAAKDVPTSDYLTRVNSLRQTLPDAMVTTFLYKPLIGVTSITDPGNVTTNYLYDSFGRLQLIKDMHGSVLKTFDYHYKQ